VLDACTTLATTADSPKTVSPTFHSTIAALVSSLAKTTTSSCATRHTLALTETNSPLAVFGTCYLALASQIAFVALAECDLFHFIIETFAMATADF